MKKYFAKSSGFSLLETIFYMTILVVVSGIFVGILVQVLRVASNQNSSAETSTQLNYAIENINYLIRSSSLADIPANSATSTLVLRNKDKCKDIIKIYLDNTSGVGIIKQETIPNPPDVAACAGSITPMVNLTTSKVNVSNLQFVKNAFYPGQDQISFDISLASNTGNPQAQISRVLHSAVSRVSAATFDSNLLAGSSDYQIGLSVSPWGKIFTKPGGGPTGGGINESLFFSAVDAGNVGIRNSSPEYPLDVTGNVRFVGNFTLNGNGTYSGTWTNSDIRFKKNIEALDAVLDKLVGINGVRYDWRKNEFPQKNFSADRQIGVIAQEVEKEFPELVYEDEQGYKNVAYDKLSAILLQAVKELKQKLDKQQTEIDDLKARIERLESKP